VEPKCALLLESESLRVLICGFLLDRCEGFGGMRGLTVAILESTVAAVGVEGVSGVVVVICYTTMGLKTVIMEIKGKQRCDLVLYLVVCLYRLRYIQRHWRSAWKRAAVNSAQFE